MPSHNLKSRKTQAKKKRDNAAFKNIALSNKNEWLTYLIKNIKNIEEDLGGSPWPKHLLKFIEKEKQNFNTTKFKGEIFNIKYIMDN